MGEEEKEEKERNSENRPCCVVLLVQRHNPIRIPPLLPSASDRPDRLPFIFTRPSLQYVVNYHHFTILKATHLTPIYLSTCTHTAHPSSLVLPSKHLPPLVPSLPPVLIHLSGLGHPNTHPPAVIDLPTTTSTTSSRSTTHT